MKIKITQLDKEARECISIALQHYAVCPNLHRVESSVNYYVLSQKIRHGELLIGEYQYNEQEKGGEK